MKTCIVCGTHNRSSGDTCIYCAQSRFGLSAAAVLLGLMVACDEPAPPPAPELAAPPVAPPAPPPVEEAAPPAEPAEPRSTDAPPPEPAPELAPAPPAPPKPVKVEPKPAPPPPAAAYGSPMVQPLDERPVTPPKEP